MGAWCSDGNNDVTNESRRGRTSRRSKWLWRGTAVLAIIGVAGLIAFRVASLRGDVPPPDTPVLAVVVEKLRAQPLEVYREYTGTIAAQHRFAVAAQVGGTVLSVPKREGERVLAGDLLAQLDATEPRAEVQRLEAAIERLEADFEYWQSQLARYRSLFATQAISEQALEDNVRQVRSLTASLKESRQSLKQARTRLGYTEIRAPRDAFVQTVFAQPGDLARANAPLLELLDDGALKVVDSLPQADQATLTPSTPAVVTVGNIGVAIEAQLDRLYPALDTSTRTATGEVILPETSAGLRPGMLASVSLRLARIDDALTVPVHAVHARRGVEGVFVLDNEVARWEPVRTGHIVGQRVQIVAGPAPGSTVIVTPDTRLVDGMPVRATSRVAMR